MLKVVQLLALAVLLGGTALADYYATKADYKAGKLTPGPPLPKGSGSSCEDDAVEIYPPFPVVHNGDTTGSLNTVDTLPLRCNGSYTEVPGPDNIFTFTVYPGHQCLTFGVSTPDPNYDPSIYLLSTCGAAKSCEEGWGSDQCWARNAARNPCGAGSGESFEIIGLAPGEYFFYVDSFYAPNNPNGRDSGPYTLTVLHPWVECVPVELLHFSVE